MEYPPTMHIAHLYMVQAHIPNTENVAQKSGRFSSYTVGTEIKRSKEDKKNSSKYPEAKFLVPDLGT